MHIIHGMSEHAARYDELASELNKEDILLLQVTIEDME